MEDTTCLVLGFYLRLDIDGTGQTLASLYDIDDVSESSPLAEVTAGSADAAVAELITNVTFNHHAG